MPDKIVNIKCDPRFIYFGKTEGDAKGNNGEGRRIGLPFPSSGPFETAVNVDSARNQNGVMVGQIVGNPIDKQSMTFSVMRREKWWAINEWLTTNGIKFWCHYFNHNLGRWMTKQFYCGNRTCEPYMVNADTGVPAFYRNCKINVIALGVE